MNVRALGGGGGPATRWGGVPKAAPEPSLYMVLRAVCLVALRLDVVVFQKAAPESPPWPVGVLVVASGLYGVVFQKMGWRCKRLSQNPHSVYYSRINNAKYQVSRSSVNWFWRRYFKFFYHIWAWRPACSCNQDRLNNFSFPRPLETTYEI